MWTARFRWPRARDRIAPCRVRSGIFSSSLSWLWKFNSGGGRPCWQEGQFDFTRLHELPRAIQPFEQCVPRGTQMKFERIHDLIHGRSGWKSVQAVARSWCCANMFSHRSTCVDELLYSPRLLGCCGLRAVFVSRAWPDRFVRITWHAFLYLKVVAFFPWRNEEVSGQVEPAGLCSPEASCEAEKALVL